jgi:outer membrane biosynthesis protein TonB
LDWNKHIKEIVPVLVSLLLCGFVVTAAANHSFNSNSTHEDTIIVQEPKEKPTPRPVTPPQPTVTETPTETIEVVQPTETREDAFAKAKEKQQLEQPTNSKKTTQEGTVQEPEPQPINVNAVVNQDGTVYVGQEFAGRQVTITGV